MIRIMGAGMIFLGCGGFGFSMAASSRREEEQLESLRAGLEYMICELSYRQTALPELCRGTSGVCRGQVRRFFQELAKELEKQAAADVQVCVYEILERMGITGELRRLLQEAGATLGRFDLTGQLRGLEASIHSVEIALRRIRDGAAQRRRSYQTLGLCAGAAIAILFL